MFQCCAFPGGQQALVAEITAGNWYDERVQEAFKAFEQQVHLPERKWWTPSSMSMSLSLLLWYSFLQSLLQLASVMSSG